MRLRVQVFAGERVFACVLACVCVCAFAGERVSVCVRAFARDGDLKSSIRSCKDDSFTACSHRYLI